MSRYAIVPEGIRRAATKEARNIMAESKIVWGSLLTLSIAFFLGAYFTFAAVQGDYGLFRRAEIVAQSAELRAQLTRLNTEVARMETLTRRMSDDFLDLDLLDEQARDVLGLLRADEIVIR